MSKRLLKMDAIDVTKACYVVNNSISFCEDVGLLSESFTRHNIPEEHQLVFFKRGILGDSISEYFTGISFAVKPTYNGNVRALLRTGGADERYAYQVFSLNSQVDNCSKKDIIDFGIALNESGELYDYISAINEYFYLNMDVDYLFELSQSGMSLARQRKIYKSKMKK